MKKLYTVLAGQDHGGNRIIRVFEARSEAEGFAEECAEYAFSRPGVPRAQDHIDPDDEDRWQDDTDRWLRAIEKWDAKHPAGSECSMDTRYSVGTVDYVPCEGHATGPSE